MTSRVSIIAAASALFLSQAGLALAQSAPGSPGTAGASNAGAASSSLGGGTPTQPGSAPGTTNPGNINVTPSPAPSPPTASPNQVPSGASIQSTTPPRAQAPVAGGGGRRTVGQANRDDAEKEPDKSDPRNNPVVQESEREVSKRIKSICRGC